MADQKTEKYGVPKSEEKVNDSAGGVLTRIFQYDFSSYSELVPGSDCNKSRMKTTFSIKTDEGGLEKTLEFSGFIGIELVGQHVQYEDKTVTTTTLFNPKERENDPSYRRGKREIERVCILVPTDKKFPSYIFKDRSQGSL